MRKSVRVKGIVILALFVLVLCIWYAAWREDARGRLTVSFLNVGQGDAIYIEAPSGRQILIDGGQDGSVLRALGSVMAPWDRSLDVVIATSAD
jgi:competence protein ComEC